MSPLPPTLDRTVFKLLWKAARTRAAGRRRRQRELLHQKKGNSSDPLGALAMLAMTVFMGIVHAALGWMLVGTLDTARIVDSERNGKLVVGYVSGFADSVKRLEAKIDKLENQYDASPIEEQKREMAIKAERYKLDDELDDFISSAADWRKHEFGGSESDHRRLIKAHFQRFGFAGFIDEDDLPKVSLAIPAGYWPFVAFILLWWWMMIVFQGEGLELDIQRRRHPMWEWVLSHPVRPVAAFAADMLSPLMANPVYFAAPVFWWLVFSSAHGALGGFVGGIVVGLPFAVAASCLNKSLEISAMLRLTPRSRGAALGLMSWLGYAAMMLPLFTLNAPLLEMTMMKWSARVAPWIPTWPVRALTTGWGDQPVLWQTIVSGFFLAVILLGVSISIAWIAARIAGGRDHAHHRIELGEAAESQPFGFHESAPSQGTHVVLAG